MRQFALLFALAMVLVAAPGDSSRSLAAQTQYIRVATLLPRDSEIARSFLKVDRQLRTATGNSWGVRLYAGGVAGDEPDVLRKMKIGQMDASIITTTGLSHIVRDVAVLDSPGVVPNYAAFDAVTAALRDTWKQSFEHAGFELLAWSDSGQYRWFSRGPIRRPSDLREHRPWLWPASFILDEIYKVIGCSGVPLGVPEVYGALQTGMIDTVIGTPVTLVQLQWHTKLKHVTKATFGVLVNGLVMNLKKWQQLPPDVAKQLRAEVNQIIDEQRAQMRQADVDAYNKLLARGYTADDWAPGGREAYAKVEREVRDRLVGRLYSAALLARVSKIAASAQTH